MAADRKPYHRACVKCFNCRTPLNPRTLNEHEEQARITEIFRELHLVDFSTELN
jgi:hypothetical protein